MCDEPKLKVTEQQHAAFIREAEDMLQRCREDAAYHNEQANRHLIKRDGHKLAIQSLQHTLKSFGGWF